MTKEMTAAAARTAERIPAYSPAVDVYETEDSFQVIADVPGTGRDNVEVRVEGGRLHIEALARLAPLPGLNRPDAPYKFVRDFALGKSVDPDRIEASLTHGVLHIRLPKREQAKLRKVEVKG